MLSMHCYLHLRVQQNPHVTANSTQEQYSYLMCMCIPKTKNRLFSKRTLINFETFRTHLRATARFKEVNQPGDNLRRSYRSLKWFLRRKGGYRGVSELTCACGGCLLARDGKMLLSIVVYKEPLLKQLSVFLLQLGLSA